MIKVTSIGRENEREKIFNNCNETLKKSVCIYKKNYSPTKIQIILTIFWIWGPQPQATKGQVVPHEEVPVEEVPVEVVLVEEVSVEEVPVEEVSVEEVSVEEDPVEEVPVE